MYLLCNLQNSNDYYFLLAIAMGLPFYKNKNSIVKLPVSKVDYIPLKGIEFENCLINLN